MNITGMVIEILIVGLQTTIVFVLFILSIFGYKWIKPELIAEFGKQSNLITILLLTFSYTLGILFDRLWDFLFESKIFCKVDEKIRNDNLKKYGFPPDTSWDAKRLRIFLKSDAAAKFLDYIRSRMRVARASCGNFALITIFSFVFILFRVDNRLKLGLLIFTVILGTLLIWLAFHAWKKIMDNYCKQTLLAYRELFKEP